MGRSASGVTGMKLRSGDSVIAMDTITEQEAKFDAPSSQRGADMMVVLENGFGKRTMLKNFNLQHRGGMGIKAANCTPKTGDVVGMHLTYSDDGDLVIATKKGQFIRMALKTIKRLGRDTQGVTLIKLKEGDKVASSAMIISEPDSNQTIFETTKDNSQTKTGQTTKTLEKETSSDAGIVVNNYKEMN